MGFTATEMLRQPEARRFLEQEFGAFSRAHRRTVPHAERKVVSTQKMTDLKQAVPQMAGQREYGMYLDTLELRYITKHEVFSAHRRSRNGVHNRLPPEYMWRRIGSALKIADNLRHRLGVKLTYIASAYRCPEYNDECPGSAKFSQHMQNRALDLVFDCPPKAAFAEAKKMRDEEKFRGGLGLYSSFIHLDTRGYNATWGA